MTPGLGQGVGVFAFAALLATASACRGAPLIVVAVVVAYLTSEALTAYVDARVGAAPSRTETTTSATAVSPAD